MNWRDGRCNQARIATVGALAKAVGAVLAAVVLAGCAAALTADAPDEAKREMARSRALARWDLLIKGDAGAAYEYLSKGSRQVVARSEFVSRMSKTQFRTVKVESVECQRESCQVQVRFTYDHPLMKNVGNGAREDWIVEDGNIWYVWSL